MAEKRLIDANYLKKRLDDMEIRNGHKYYRAGMDDALHDFMPQRIDEQPTVDAVEVVRCKDCKSYCHIIGKGDRAILGCSYMGRDVKPDDFCSYGERKNV